MSISALAPPSSSATDLTFLPIAEALQQEQALLQQVVDAERCAGFMLWKTQQALVVPSRLSRKNKYQYACDRMAKQHWAVVKRSSGGDVVPQTPGIVNISIAFLLPPQHSPGNSVVFSYGILCAPIIKALQDVGIEGVGLGDVSGAFCDGSYNVTILNKKVAGTAQRWRWSIRNGERRPAIMAHAALIVDERIDVMVDAVNSFYRLCGIAKRCEYTSHSTVFQAAGKCARHQSEEFQNKLNGALAYHYRQAMAALVEANDTADEPS